jgi:alpha-beta hydrolase superfamily lysophospholipase
LINNRQIKEVFQVMNGNRSALIISMLVTITTAFGARAAQAPSAKSFPTADGAVLSGDVYPARDKNAPTVILLHMLGRTRASFAPLVGPLVQSGFGVINIDLRGHGQSTATTSGKSLNYQNFTAQDWTRLPSDANTIIQDVGKVPGLNGSALAVVGSSIGANTAALVGNNPEVKALVLLSPGADYHGLEPERPLKTMQKPILIFAGKGDAYSADSIKRWGNLGPKCQVELLNTSAHGNDLLKDPAVVGQIVTFLKSQLKP